jgi:hypothetical protein
MDKASGSGWLQLSSKDEVEGLIKMHGGDRSTFKARKASWWWMIGGGEWRYNKPMSLWWGNPKMIESLQRIIAEIEKLPTDTQDAIASRLLAELEDEKAWSDRFEATTDQQWDNLAVMVRQEISAGDTISLDEFFPSHSWNQASPKNSVNDSINCPKLSSNRLARPIVRGAQILTIAASNSRKLAWDSRFTLFGLD